MKRISLFCALIVPLCAADVAIQLDPSRTTVDFTLGAMLHTVHGTFQLKRGAMTFDPATGSASGQIVVDAAGGDTGNSLRDKRMHREILETPRFPEAIFTPDRVTGTLAPQGESQLDVHGTLQVHGAAHDATLHMRADVSGNRFTASTRLVVPYVEWGMKNPSNLLLKVTDKVDVAIQAEGSITRRD